MAAGSGSSSRPLAVTPALSSPSDVRFGIEIVAWTGEDFPTSVPRAWRPGAARELSGVEVPLAPRRAGQWS